MALPTTTVLLDFSSGATFSYPFTIGDVNQGRLGFGTLSSAETVALFADLTSTTKEISIIRGRNISRDTYEAGECRIRVLDPNSYFNPQNTSSPYYGKLVPLRKIRITADATSGYFLFSGYTTTYSYFYDQTQNVGYVDISCVDAFRLLQQAGITTVAGTSAGQNTGARITNILDQVQYPTSMRSISTGNSLVQADPATSRAALGAIKNCEFSEQGAFYCNAAGNLIFKNRTEVIQSPNTTPIEFNQTTGIPYANLKYAFDDKLIVNVTNVTRTGGTVQQATNADSVAAYFPHSNTYTDLVVQTDAEALNIAKLWTATRAATTIRIDEMTIDLNDDAVNTDTVLGMDYFTNVTITNVQPNGSTITKTLQIQGVKWYITPTKMTATFTTLERIDDGILIGNSTFGVLGQDILTY